MEFDRTSLIGVAKDEIQKHYERFIEQHHLPYTRELQMSDYAQVHQEWGQKPHRTNICTKCSLDSGKPTTYKKACQAQRDHTCEWKRRIRYFKIVHPIQQ